MPEQESARAVELAADLHISFSSERGDAAAHLHGDSDGLILDVDHPAVLLNEVRGQQLPLQSVRDVISDTSVQIRSQGRDLGRFTLSPNGKVRVRPTPAGLSTGLGIVLSSWRSRLVIGAGGLAVAVVAYRSLKRTD